MITCIWLQNDPWNIPAYMKQCTDVPMVAAITCDGRNMAHARQLNGLAMGVFWTQQGLDEARLGGYTGPATVIPLGVDREIYQPLPKADARRVVGLGERFDDAFIVGVVGRNQPRKRLDLMIEYFAMWVKTHNVGNAVLLLHVAPTGERAYDLIQLAQYYGIANRCILVEPDVWNGVPESRMVYLYNSLDLLATTTQGEGWGLPMLEAMACGVPVLAPDWSALGDWARDAAELVPCTGRAVTTGGGINMIGGIADRDAYVDALNELYEDDAHRKGVADSGYGCAVRPVYDWSNIGQAWQAAIDDALNSPFTVTSTSERKLSLVE